MGKIKSLHVYDFGPNGNYRESLKALRVVSRMPAGDFLKETPPPPFVFYFFFGGGVVETSKNVAQSRKTGKENGTQTNIQRIEIKNTTPFRFPPLHQSTRLIASWLHAILCGWVWQDAGI